MKIIAALFLLLAVAVKPTQAQPKDGDGEWGDVFKLGVIPIHAMLLPSSQVLMYGTDDQGRQGGDVFYAVWDPRSGEHDVVDNHFVMRHETGVNIFCTTATLDAKTGNYLLIGGDNDDNYGIRDVLEFNTKTLEVRRHPKGSMKYPRWYATSISLPNGNVFVVGGRGDPQDGSPIPELWTPDDGFRELKNAEVPAIAGGGPNWWYPIALVNSSGDIVVIIDNGDNTDVYRVGVDGDGSIEKVGEKPFDMHVLSPAVMYRIDLVMMIAKNGDLWVGDISDSSNPSFEKRNNIGSGRTNAATNILPDGRVIIVGGCATHAKNGNTLSDAVKHVQIWNPEDNSIYNGPSEEIARLYHSTALILPDGSLYSGGGGAPGPLVNTNGNIYKPGYLADLSKRPIIRGWPQQIGSGESFEIIVDDASNVDMVTMTKAGAVTHARNCDQRWLDLDFEILGGGKIRVYTPGRNIMIGGLWMVNIISDGYPSEGRLMGIDIEAVLDHLYVPDDIVPVPDPQPVPAPVSVPVKVPVPVASPSTKAEIILSIVRGVTLSTGTILYPPSSIPSPEELAVEWLANEDFLNLENKFRVIQRYALASIYFSTNGDSWTSNDNWLQPVSECEWFGITCVAGQSALERIILDNNNLDGELSPDSQLFEFLEELSLEGNPKLGQVETTPPPPPPPPSPGKLTVPFEIAALQFTASFAFDNEESGACNPGSLVGAKYISDATCISRGAECTVGWTAADEWLRYDFELPEDEYADITIRFSSLRDDKRLLVELDGTSLATYNGPANGWDTFEDRIISSVLLGKGDHQLYLRFLDGQINVCSVSIK